MSLFKKLFGKKKKEKEKKQECWYNNYQRDKDGTFKEPIDGAALSGANSYEFSYAKSVAMK